VLRGAEGVLGVLKGARSVLGVCWECVGVLQCTVVFNHKEIELKEHIVSKIVCWSVLGVCLRVLKGGVVCWECVVVSWECVGVLQCAVVFYRKEIQHMEQFVSEIVCWSVLVCCNVLQCAAVCCDMMQRVAVCCSVLQCAVMLYLSTE